MFLHLILGSYHFPDYYVMDFENGSQEWIVGDLKKESNIFVNYASEKYQGFKKRINNADWIENSPCIKCKRDIRGHKK